ncbi:uroporphyrinogen-III synthase [Sphingopyxis yananensis]|uniref:uroporphyrinogen-III synthase n=1 Tax=Sphingopyxis yananensis TaxID=2886687 RepID=UPI001D129C23|nr:uroporphyrinogen-III synthase [Sphingopyxis yananensis]MCC2601411.1 uroporphyrinogen-III synthase [Sphingopyxis yananensis]
MAPILSAPSLPLLIIRPQPVAEQSCQRAQALGLDAHSLPLFAAQAIRWAVPDIAPYDALLVTSAQAMRLGGAGLQQLLPLPVYAVGAASADAARAKGFRVEQVGDSDGQTLLGEMQTKGIRTILWLNGRDHSVLDGGLAQLHRLPCYAVDRIAPPPQWHDLVKNEAVLMAHSTRAAEYLNDLVPSPRDHLTLIAISSKVAAAAGAGWGQMLVADHPTDAAMLAVAAKLCHKQPH